MKHFFGLVLLVMVVSCAHQDSDTLIALPSDQHHQPSAVSASGSQNDLLIDSAELATLLTPPSGYVMVTDTSGIAGSYAVYLSPNPGSSGEPVEYLVFDNIGGDAITYSDSKVTGTKDEVIDIPTGTETISCDPPAKDCYWSLFYDKDGNVTGAAITVIKANKP